MSKNQICVGIVAHVDAGKTTITEQFLYKSGLKKTLGRVDHKDASADYLAVEKERGITVRATSLAFPWKDKTIHLLDTPGHVDFIAEVERSLSVLDAAVLAISAKEGVQTQTRVLFNALKRLGIPTFIFINKIDRFGVELEKVYQEIEKTLTPDFIRLQSVESGNVLIDFEADFKLHEAADDILSKFSDAYLEKVLAEEVDTDMRLDEIGRLFKEGKCYPLLHGAALHGLGVEALLDACARWVAFLPDSELRGRCYKIDRDEKGNRRCFVRLTGGRLELRGTYPVLGYEEPIKMRQLAKLEGITARPCAEVSAGEIAIVYDPILKIEDVIGGGGEEAQNEAFRIATPTLMANVAYEHLGQRKEILKALEILTDEDPFLAFRIHPVTEAIEVKLFGSVQKEILIDLLKERFDICTSIDEPMTLYKEKPSEMGRALMQMYRHTPLAATIGLEVQPLEVGAGFQYQSKVSLGDLKKPFQTAVSDGVKKAVERGVGQWPLTDLKVIFVESAFDSVNSTPSDYRKLAEEVLLKALESMPLTLMEPLLSYEMEIPAYAIGKAVADVLKMGGVVSDPEIVGEFAYLSGIVPVDTSKNYLEELADYTEGKGRFNTKFFGYRESKKGAQS